MDGSTVAVDLSNLTGKANYKAPLSDTTGTNLRTKSRNLLLNEADAMIAALWYWNSRNLKIYVETETM